MSCVLQWLINPIIHTKTPSSHNPNTWQYCLHFVVHASTIISFILFDMSNMSLKTIHSNGKLQYRRHLVPQMIINFTSQKHIRWKHSFPNGTLSLLSWKTSGLHENLCIMHSKDRENRVRLWHTNSSIATYTFHRINRSGHITKREGWKYIFWKRWLVSDSYFIHGKIVLKIL
jgi:hypothetical protein